MKYLNAFKKNLYELRFSPMCKPASEVANLTKLESQSSRAISMMMWRISEGIIGWGKREIELIYQSTLDSISEAFHVFHYPISRHIAAARADVWEAGLAPRKVREVVEASQSTPTGGKDKPDKVAEGGSLLLAGEIAQIGEEFLLSPMIDVLQTAGISASKWIVQTGALCYSLGARDVAKKQAAKVVEGIKSCQVQIVIADGPETAWALTKIYPELGFSLPHGITVKLLSEELNDHIESEKRKLGRILIHDSRPACLIADQMANNLAILPGYCAQYGSQGLEAEKAFGTGSVYEAPRELLDRIGALRVFGTWTRSLSKTSGADDGLWLTYPELAGGLAAQRLDYAVYLGTDMIVTDSPLAAAWLAKHINGRPIEVKLLAGVLT